MNDLEKAQKLREAAAYLRANGWRQFLLGNHGESRCLVGAILSGCGDSAFHKPELLVDWDAIGRIAPYVTSLVEPMGFTWSREGLNAADWNNDPGRTLEEVLDRLESTALALEVRFLSQETPAIQETAPAELVGV